MVIGSLELSGYVGSGAPLWSRQTGGGLPWAKLNLHVSANAEKGVLASVVRAKREFKMRSAHLPDNLVNREGGFKVRERQRLMKNDSGEFLRRFPAG